MSYYQYRITVNGAQSRVLDKCPSEQWTRVAEVIDSRSGIASFERRLVTDKDIMPLLTDPSGYIVLDDMVVCPWTVIAGMET